MKQILLMIAVVALVGCGGKKETNSDTPIQTGDTKTCFWCKESIKAAALVCKHCGKNPDVLLQFGLGPVVEKAIREELKKPTGKLTEADLEKVKTLNLYKKQLTDVPKGLEKLTKLTGLVLAENQLTSVKGLENLTQLTQLALADNKLTDVKGLEKLTQLTYLELWSNKLTSVKGLEKLTQLTFLSLGNNSDLTKAQIAELQKALPKCTILSNPKK